ncbi:putative protein TIC214 [Rosa chinensis]|uniref:Uncharacterized protein n=1 Tax=Rosa chinensis TaxID=74649 RepID=A0A2P6RW01_ROSCH|nr:putative protein TIC214 [Rosa chinensis]
MEEGEEGTEKQVSATTGFITRQLIMFISIYNTPLHLALCRPHTITVLALLYLLFHFFWNNHKLHFFWNNHKHFFDYGSTTRNSMHNLCIQCLFLNNLIFQLGKMSQTVPQLKVIIHFDTSSSKYITLIHQLIIYA